MLGNNPMTLCFFMHGEPTEELLREAVVVMEQVVAAFDALAEEPEGTADDIDRH